MKTLLPKAATKSNRLQSNSTHIAIFANNHIEIWMKGLTWKNDDGSISLYPAELLWTIEEGDQDDLLAIFDRLDEDNRCNLAEANAAMQN